MFSFAIIPCSLSGVSIATVFYKHTSFLQLIDMLVCIWFAEHKFTTTDCNRFHLFQPITFAIVQLLCQLVFIHHCFRLMMDRRKWIPFLLASLFIVEIVLSAIAITRFNGFVLPPEANNGCLSSGGIDKDTFVMLC